MSRRMLSLLEYSDIPDFSDQSLEVESYILNGDKFKLKISIEGSVGHYTSDNQATLTLDDAFKLKRFIEKSIKEYVTLVNKE